MTTRMAQEIAEQPEAVERTLDALLPRREEIRRLAEGRSHVLFVARGSSCNAAVYGRYLLEVHTDRGAALAAPSLATHYEIRRELSDSLVVSLSQSGQTEEIVATQRWAADNGAATIAITNGADSALVGGADLALVTEAGPELAVPATKSYTTQLAALAVLADAFGPPEATLEPALRTVPEAIATLLEARSGVDAAVEALVATDDSIVTGRGLVFPTALEVALKLEETSLEPVRSLSYADLRHGPIAIVDPELAAVIVAAQDGPMTGGMVDLARDLGQRGAVTIAIGGDEELRRTADVTVPGPHLPEPVAPLGLIVPAQLVVETLARRRGLDPDTPRGLSKVTQTDVPAADPA